MIIELAVLLALLAGGGLALWFTRRAKPSPEREAAVDHLRTETKAAEAEQVAAVREAEAVRDEQLEQAKEDPQKFVDDVVARVKARRGVGPLLLLLALGVVAPARADCEADAVLLAKEVVRLEADITTKQENTKVANRKLSAALAVVMFAGEAARGVAAGRVRRGGVRCRGDRGAGAVSAGADSLSSAAQSSAPSEVNAPSSTTLTSSGKAFIWKTTTTPGARRVPGNEWALTGSECAATTG